MASNIITRIASAIALIAGTCIVNAQDFAAMHSSCMPSDIIKGTEAGFRTSWGYDFIRGVNSLYSDSQPLYIIDGAYVNQGYSSLSFLSAYDIESIEVLKNATETARYGAAGANGVVIIKTRGSSSGKADIRLTSNLGTMIADGKDISFNHNHYISLSGQHDLTSYNLSGFYKNASGEQSGYTDRWGGVKVNVSTRASKYIWFDVNALFSKGLTEYGVDDENFKYHATGSANFRVNFLDCLYWNTVSGVDFSGLNRIRWYGNDTEYGRENNGVSVIDNASLINYNAVSTLNFDRKFNIDHLLKISVGARFIGNTDKNGINTGSNFITHALRGRGLSLMESERVIRKYNHSYSRFAVLADIEYAFKGYFSMSGHYELAKTPKYDDNFLNFYSLKACVDLKKLFNVPSKAISTLKISGGYGTSGSENYYPYVFTSSHLPGFIPEIDEGGAPYFDSFERVASREWNVDLDFGFIGSRLFGKLAYYDKTSDEKFNIYSFGRMAKNGIWDRDSRTNHLSRDCSFGNRGFEISFTGRIIDRKNVAFTLTFNGAYNINQISKVTNDDMFGVAEENGIHAFSNVIGYPIGAFVGYRDSEDGCNIDLNRDGRISNADKVMLGSWIPVFNGSLNFDLRIKRFAFEALIYGEAGNQRCDFESILADKKKEISSKYIQNGDCLHLARIGVSYDIPLHRRVVKGVRLNLCGANLTEILRRSAMVGATVLF